jgi:aldehyde dehydrogenase (NAD+)
MTVTSVPVSNIGRGGRPDGLQRRDVAHQHERHGHCSAADRSERRECPDDAAGGDHDPSIPGYFVPVTVLDNPPEDARIVAEEQFGPVMPLMKFSTINEVISRANASDYGLAGSIWTSNPEAAVEVAEQLETGTVWINESMHLAPNAPFAGHKQSGFGAELGEEGLLEFTYPQVITIAREAA